jgi:6-phosphogluconolactonase
MSLRSPLYKDLYVVPDKGDGHVYMYTIDRANDKLLSTDKVLALRPGCQPRYAAYHPAKPFVFVNHEAINEGEMVITSFKYNESGKLEKIGNYSVLLQTPDTIPATINSQQGFVIHPSGKYLYSICRNPRMVAVMEVNEETGELKAIQNATVTGQQPRGIAITPDGKFIVTGAIHSGDISVFAVGSDGKLTMVDGKSNQAGVSYFSFYDPKL